MIFAKDRWVEILEVNPDFEDAKALLVLFPGGTGKIYDSFGQPTNNFLVRSYMRFSRKGFNVLVFGDASWASDGYSDQDRVSNNHIQDIQNILSKVNPKNLPVYLIGTSRGTISALHGALQLGIQIEGLILTSTTVVKPVFQSLKVDQIKSPILVVHHKKDACSSSLPTDSSKFFNSLSKATQIWVDGGIEISKNPCRAMTFHGFWGQDERVVSMMTDWILQNIRAAKL